MLAGLEEVREGADTLTHSLTRTYTHARTHTLEFADYIYVPSGFMGEKLLHLCVK